jgi:hypothetical protein
MDLTAFRNRFVALRPNAAMQHALAVNRRPRAKVSTAVLKPIFRAAVNDVLALSHSSLSDNGERAIVSVKALRSTEP